MKNRFRKLLPFGERLKMPPRAVTIVFLLAFGAIAITSVISGGMGAYEHALSEEAAGGQALAAAFKVGAAILFALLVLGAVLFFEVALITSVVIPSAVEGYRATRSAIAAAPGAARRCRARLISLRAHLVQFGGMALRYFRTVPQRIAALKAEDWFFALFAFGVVAIFSGSLYLGWGIAAVVYQWLPEWLKGDGSFTLMLLIDWLICMIPIVILVTIWGSLTKWIMRRWVGRGRSGTKR